MMEKLKRLRALMDEKNVNGMIITNEINRRYMTDFTGSAGTVIVTQKEAYLLVDFRYTEQATAQATHFTVKQIGGSSFYKEIDRIVKQLGINKLGFEQNHISYSNYVHMSQEIDTELIPLSGLVEKLRSIKSNDEINIIKEAISISDAAFSHILSYIRPGITEIDIANELEFYMRKLGASSSSFDMIIASGIRSAMPHGVATDKQIEKGDIITLDFGAYFNGYCSDMTRTIAVGEPPSKIKEIYTIVNGALNNALKGLKSGLTGREADVLTRDYIQNAGYGEFYGHGTGHGIGLYIHEDISLSPNSNEVLEEGMVLTVEPGIYLPGIGGVRIEDDVLIKENGIEILTKSTKELIIL